LESIEYIKTGKLPVLAVTTAARSEMLPNIPTVGDAHGAGDVLLRNPITGIAGFCALAPTGHATAPPSFVTPA
jgi:tripartite-type tricarboxylate transporter receptor subunit TctC